VRRSARASADKAVKEIGDLVRRARIRAGVTQEEAAHAAAIDYKRWQRLEAGEVNATVRTLVRVAAAVGTDLWGLLERSGGGR
jgi:transcriptional regulator with XRE-family HTH domain